ncbi:MAG: hypothetical protein H0T41_01515 [Rhodobacteraceae bacterium]|nr:hypothetical protein [Paracoccaceae bacterium]
MGLGDHAKADHAEAQNLRSAVRAQAAVPAKIDPRDIIVANPLPRI